MNNVFLGIGLKVKLKSAVHCLPRENAERGVDDPSGRYTSGIQRFEWWRG